jgi:hypothetical protein
VYLGRQQFAQCAVLFTQTQGLRIDRRLIIEIRIAVVLRSEWIWGRGGHGLKNIDTKACGGNYDVSRRRLKRGIEREKGGLAGIRRQEAGVAYSRMA